MWISLDKSVCRDLEAVLSREWLETNGLGGFACGRVAEANTRSLSRFTYGSPEPARRTHAAALQT
jgi:hypothetical protein